MNEKEAIKIHSGNVVTCLDETLLPLGFEPQERKERIGGNFMWFWRRGTEWKIDVVQFHYSASFASHFDINIIVEVPDAEMDMGVRTLDATTLAYIAGQGEGYRMPSFFGTVVGWRSEQFAKKICRDLERKSCWFDKYKDPMSCLAQLRTGTTNGCGPESSKAYQWMEEYLLNLISNYRMGAALSEQARQG